MRCKDTTFFVKIQAKGQKHLFYSKTTSNNSPARFPPNSLHIIVIAVPYYYNVVIKEIVFTQKK